MRGAPFGRLGCATFSPPLRYGENVAYAGNVRRKTAPDFLVEDMIDLDKQFLNPAPKTPGVHYMLYLIVGE